MWARQNRWTTRISFLLVLLMAAVGFWYAATFWRPAVSAVDLSNYSSGVDWVETTSAVGEQAIQLLLGATSGK